MASSCPRVSQLKNKFIAVLRTVVLFYTWSTWSQRLHTVLGAEMSLSVCRLRHDMNIGIDCLTALKTALLAEITHFEYLIFHNCYIHCHIIRNTQSEISDY